MIKVIIFLFLIFISYLIIEVYIRKIKKKYVQPLLEIGPSHSFKKGTPTMGGVSFIAIYIVIVLILLIINIRFNLFTDVYYIYVLLVTIIGYFLIGFKDDYDKVSKKKNEYGLSAQAKLILQFIVGVLIVAMLMNINFSTEIIFYSINLTVDFGLLYYGLVIIMLLATTNATNLTDGIDGLLSSNIIISLTFMSIIAFLQSNYQILYSNIILICVLMAFFLHNKNPAKIFMGDVGSLALGGYLAVCAIILKIEILFILFSFIYLMETISVILQTLYFKYTKKKTGEGKRIFLMTPIHHHFEKQQLKENQIVVLFCIINIIFSIFGLVIYII